VAAGEDEGAALAVLGGAPVSVAWEGRGGSVSVPAAFSPVSFCFPPFFSRFRFLCFFPFRRRGDPSWVYPAFSWLPSSSLPAPPTCLLSVPLRAACASGVLDAGMAIERASALSHAADAGAEEMETKEAGGTAAPQGVEAGGRKAFSDGLGNLAPVPPAPVTAPDLQASDENVAGSDGEGRRRGCFWATSSGPEGCEEVDKEVVVEEERDWARKSWNGGSAKKAGLDHNDRGEGKVGKDRTCHQGVNFSLLRWAETGRSPHPRKASRSFRLLRGGGGGGDEDHSSRFGFPYRRGETGHSRAAAAACSS